MDVSEIMSRDVDLARSDMSVSEAARLMRDHDIGALPVGEGDRLIGMVTDHDIVVRVLPESLDPANETIERAMSPRVLYCFEDQDVEEVAWNMGENQIRRLPVLNREKRLVGMVSLGDIAHHASESTAGGALGEIAEERG